MSKRLDEIIKKRGKTAYWVGATAGVATNHMYDILTGKRYLTPEVALRIAKALEVNPFYLLELNDNSELTPQLEKLSQDFNTYLATVKMLKVNK